MSKGTKKLSTAEERMMKIAIAEQEPGMLNELIRSDNVDIVEEILRRGRVDAKTFADHTGDRIPAIYHCQSPEMLRLLVSYGGEQLITKEHVQEDVPCFFSKFALTACNLKVVRCLFEEFHLGTTVGDTIRNVLYYTARNKVSRKAWDEEVEDDVFLYVFQKFPELVKIKITEEGMAEYPITPILVRGDITIIREALKNSAMRTALSEINFDDENNIIHEMVQIVSAVKRTSEDAPREYAVNPKTAENYKHIIRLFSENFPEFLSERNHDGLTPFAYAARANELDLAQEMFEICPSILATDSNLNEKEKIALIPAVVRGKKFVSEELILAALDEKMFDLFSHLREKTTEKLFKGFLPKIYEKLCVAITENDIESAIKIAEIFPEFIEKKYLKPVRPEASSQEESIEDEEGETSPIPTIGFALELGRNEIVDAFHKILEKKFPISEKEKQEIKSAKIEFEAAAGPSEKVAILTSRMAQLLREITEIKR